MSQSPSREDRVDGMVGKVCRQRLCDFEAAWLLLDRLGFQGSGAQRLAPAAQVNAALVISGIVPPPMIVAIEDPERDDGR